jgi:hypothetical protein
MSCHVMSLILMVMARESDTLIASGVRFMIALLTSVVA